MSSGTPEPGALPPWARVPVLATTVAGLLLGIAFASPGGTIFFVAYSGIGTYLAIRRPASPVGWLLIAAGWGLAIGSVTCTVPVGTLTTGPLEPLEAATAWANSWGWSLVFLAFFGITLVFPGGHMPGGRARWPSRLALGAIIALTVLLAVAPTISVTQTPTGRSLDIANPLALAPDAAVWALVPVSSLLYLIQFGIVVTGILALIVRYRRSVGVERLQYRWLVAATAFVAVASLTWAITTMSSDPDLVIGWVLTFIAYPCVPIAIAIAILRYRLFEIDRIISRTIAYAVVTAIVASVFGLGIVLLSSGLSSVAQGQTIAVAGSTLLAFAIFQPILRRVRRDVDRRFDRARYDAEGIAIAFSDRLRYETDMETVTHDLARTATEAVAPTSMALWLRPRTR